MPKKIIAHVRFIGSLHVVVYPTLPDLYRLVNIAIAKEIW